MTDVTPRQTAREATAHRTEADTAEGSKPSKGVAATIRRIAHADRRILRALAAFDRGERPAA
jgi:hypothetical protein